MPEGMERAHLPPDRVGVFRLVRFPIDLGSGLIELVSEVRWVKDGPGPRREDKVVIGPGRRGEPSAEHNLRPLLERLDGNRRKHQSSGLLVLSPGSHDTLVVAMQ